jgi:hypothetical protein
MFLNLKSTQCDEGMKMRFKTPILISRTESILIIDNFNNMILHSNPV